MNKILKNINIAADLTQEDGDKILMEPSKSEILIKMKAAATTAFVFGAKLGLSSDEIIKYIADCETDIRKIKVLPEVN